jgi:hypothetical protein
VELVTRFKTSSLRLLLDDLSHFERTLANRSQLVCLNLGINSPTANAAAGMTVRQQELRQPIAVRSKSAPLFNNQPTNTTQMKKLITIITLIAAGGFAYADQPKLKSYVELQRERMAAADAAYARHKAEREAFEKATQDETAQKAAAAAQAKVAREEHRKKMAIAAASAPKVSVGVHQSIRYW